MAATTSPRKNPWGAQPATRPVALTEIQSQELIVSLTPPVVVAPPAAPTHLSVAAEPKHEAAPDVKVSPAEDADTDALIAALLQAEFDAEYDANIAARQHIANISNQKVSITMSHLMRNPSPITGPPENDTPDLGNDGFVVNDDVLMRRHSRLT